MDWSELEQCFSSPRLNRYARACKGDVGKAAVAYPHNLQLAEALLPCLHVVEIALRNSIHRRLTTTYGALAWWDTPKWTNDASFWWQNQKIQEAIADLGKRNESQTPDKIVAELTFGFWTSLFNSHFQHNLWGPLRHAFPDCPKSIRKRDTISKRLSQVREIRNRAFHHEPLLWLGPTLEEQYKATVEVIGWLNPKLCAWLAPFDRFPTTWQKWTAAKTAHGL